MFTSVSLFLSPRSDENDSRSYVRLSRKILRDNSNILGLPDAIFLKNFRLTKEVFLHVLDLLDLPNGTRSSYIPATLQLGATLNLLGGGGYQRQVGSDWLAPMGQSTVARITSKVIRKMQSKLCPSLIRFSQSESTKAFFYQKYKIPGVTGCIDGTHIMLLRPTENEHMFFNRKLRHSINAMVICDENSRILAVDAKYGGSAHDSFVWRQSNERDLLERNYELARSSSWLLGDSGYPLEPFLITPYRCASENSAEAHFNNIHAQARSIVERCIGRLKTRWRITLEERKCRYSPQRVVEITNVCAALHNISLIYNVPLPQRMIRPEEEIQYDDPTLLQTPSREAQRIRDRIRDDLAASLT